VAGSAIEPKGVLVMKSKVLFLLFLAAVAFTLAVGVGETAAAQSPEQGGHSLPCGIAGTWHGFNTSGEVFVITITRTGAGTFSAIGQGPSDPSVLPGVYESFSTQGDLTRSGPGEFESSWVGFSTLDPTIYGFELGAIAAVGSVTMVGCDLWEASFSIELLGFNLGEDPFEDGVSLGEFGPYDATYRRIPRLPQ